jgi:hypothetical protein
MTVKVLGRKGVGQILGFFPVFNLAHGVIQHGEGDATPA